MGFIHHDNEDEVNWYWWVLVIICLGHNSAGLIWSTVKFSTRSLFPDYLVPCHCFLLFRYRSLFPRLSGSLSLFSDYLDTVHCFQTIWFLVIVFWLSGSWSLFSDYLDTGNCFQTIWFLVIFSYYLVPGQCFLPVSISGFWSLFPVKLETVQCFLAIRILVNASHIYHYLVPGHCFWLSISRSLFSDCLNQGHCFLTVWIKVIVFWLWI